ncbi:MAG TPA: peptidyl-prolyl cis-trans isomerase [Vicinamibacterales bacterium]|nr:peptidyl-prolyl cis-trans isomerase [Vicinamibacterales bacterium]
MTMLDRMRRHKGWLKWSLALVVLTFVVFYIPDFLTPSAGAAPTEVLAAVDNEEITVREFQRRYNAQIQAYRNAYGAQMNDQLLRQLGIEQQILQQMVDEEAMVVEARRQGISVNDVEIRERILAIPAFQENGKFIGETRYRQMLQFNNPPLTTTEFEDNLRRAVLVEKLRNAVTGWMSVSDDEVGAEFRRRNEKVKLDVVPLTPDAFRSQVVVTDADLAAHFEKSKEAYRIGEKRKIRYALVNVDQVRQQVTVPEAEIEAFYKQNNTQYSTPEQLKASHILFKTEGQDEAAVRKQAEDVLKRVKAGEDFAALAKQYSTDDTNNSKGGDLGEFGRGSMVPEFEQAAFALKAGETSDLVKTSFGFHIIKVAENRPATTRPMADVRPEIEDQLKWQKAQQQAEQIAKSVEAQIKTTADLDRIAKERGFQVQDTGAFLRDEPIDGLGPAPEVAAQAFQLADGAVSPALRVARGWVFATVIGKEEPRLPQLPEVTDRVRDDLVRERAAALAKTKAAEIATMLKGAGDFAAAARKAGLEVKPTELIPRNSPIPDIGVSAEIDNVVFALPVGAVSDPITTPQGTAIVRVAQKEDVTAEQISAGLDQTREELVNQRRERFFSGYMVKAKEKLKITINQETLTRALGPAPAGAPASPFGAPAGMPFPGGQ